MFNFMKKHNSADREREKEEKERKKRDKKEKKAKKASYTPDELRRLDEGHRLYGERSPGGSSSVTPSESFESVSSVDRDSPRETTPDQTTYTSSTQVHLTKPSKTAPQVHPRPHKRGILKGKSNYGPDIPNQGVRGNLDDTMTLTKNTIDNEELSSQVPGRQASVKALVRGFNQYGSGEAQVLISNGDSRAVNADPVVPQVKVSRSDEPLISSTQQSLQTQPYTEGPPSNAPPLPSSTPPLDQNLSDSNESIAEKSFGQVNLQLPVVASPYCPKPREISLKRLEKGDFGFTLRRGTVLERDVGDNKEKKRTVIFAEPGLHSSNTGLLPGDRLIEVNGVNVEKSAREDIIGLIRSSGVSVNLKVQPIPELSELSLRSGLEGEVVEIHERSIAMGTLQRSGSMRFNHHRQAKTEAQIASEKAWLQADRVWLVHKGGFAAANILRDEDEVDGGRGERKVKLEHGGEVLQVEDEDVEKANPPQFDRVEDLATLRYLNESSVLHTLRQRYGSNLVHSYAGRMLLLVNPMHPLSIYSEKVIQMFRGCKPEDMPPHIYATAQQAYRDLLASRKDQSIVLLGRSGAGKTSSLKHLLHFFTLAASTPVLNVEKVSSLFLVLEAFGKSRTMMNTNASRFTLLTSLDFDHTGQIAALSLQVMMLERGRVARRPEGEPTFHIFYQMLAGIDSMTRKSLHLENLNEPNIFMTPLQRSEDRQRATQAWAKIQHAFTVLGITDSEQKALLAVMAAIYHLGVAGVATGTNNKYQFARPAAAQNAASVLGCSPQDLARCVFSPQTAAPQTRGGLRPDRSPSSPVHHQPMSGLDCLEGFVTGLYSEAFTALVSLLNRSLVSNARILCSILILDTPGFQNPETVGRQGGASLEDLCHNYIQERLQLLLHEKVFTAEQDLYAQEDIECDFEMVTTSSARMVALLDQPTAQSRVRSPNLDKQEQEYMGLLWLLDEEAISQGATEETMIQRFVKLNPEKGHKRDALIKSVTSSSITLNHFQGTNPVTYNTKGWLRLARENPVSRSVSSFLHDSQQEEISTLFLSVRGSTGTVSGSIVGMDGASSLRRTASMRRTFTSTAASVKRKSLCLQVKFQVDTIIDSLRRTKSHFVHCLLPQHNAGLCDLKGASMGPPSKPGSMGSPSENIMMNVPVVRAQLRGGEVLEAIRIHRQGFPEHIQFGDFRKKFDVLVPSENKPSGTITDEKQAVEELLQHLDVPVSSYRIGLSQVFFRSGGLSQLENARDEKITDFIIRVQAQCRGHRARQALKKLKVQHVAARCIQRNVRLFVAIREWPWWRLYNKVKPLLNVHRTEEELRLRETELEQLRARLEKSDRERSEYKQSVDKMEAQMSEMSAELNEEHTASTEAAEMLEREGAERRRSEKELRDIQSKFSLLERRHEQTEMELMQTRLAAASYETDEDELDGGDTVYRDRYERSRRETEMVRQQLKREHQEELSSVESGRRHADKKLHEALDEVEELRRQLQTSKRRSQRVQNDVADSKLHLQEALARNNELEKKQRRFDAEVHKTAEILKEERALRDKLQRERDQYATDKYTVEQSLKSSVLDNELYLEKIKQLETELQELTTSDKDDRELVQLKRTKNELERTLADHKDELDEQAGTIQQLEQSKLRLEMQQEKMRQQHVREVEEREQEMEELRSTTLKKVRAVEAQIEEDYAEKQSLVKEKRELERRLQEMAHMTPARDTGLEKRLRHDLQHTKALLHDAQVVIDRHNQGAASKSSLRQLRNQLEDAEYAAAAAVKARKGTEMEVQDLQQQLEDLSHSKQECEERIMQLIRERTELQTQIEDHDEDTDELLRKYKAAVLQTSQDTQRILAQSQQLEDLQREKDALREEVAALHARLDNMRESHVEREALVRVEARVRELESKCELETSSRQRAEGQLSRAKEQTQKESDEKSHLMSETQRQQEAARNLQRQLRDLQEEHNDLQRKEVESSQKKHDLEAKMEVMEGEVEQGQSDLRLAFKRITDLQAALQEDLNDDSDEEVSDYLDSTDVESDDDLPAVSYSHNRFLSSDLSLDEPR